jgi:hypothetical protein
MRDAEILAAVGAGPDPASQGFDPATEARVWAAALVRARARLGYYQTLYAALVDAGRPYLIENLDETTGTRPAKLVFSADPADFRAAATRSDINVWSEATLLDQLVKERALLDFFTGVLDEFLPAVTLP